MQFIDDALRPDCQDELIITAAPYGPEWLPADFPEDIPVTLEEQVRKAVDCYNAGATACTSTSAKPTARAASGCRCSTS